ncbi:MAG: WYL domain-containing protein [Oscillospiraceae bacterium]|nr:WYL domain-containing protein [Oscillospiraceae bacterium]
MYTELIKNFSRIRKFMQEFYVYGFKSREEYDSMSRRSYDDERRRIESFLSGSIQFRRTADAKTVYISVDSRKNEHNPFFRAWKAKSFTDGDITLHFIIFDILYSPETRLTLNEISEQIDEHLAGFDCPRTFDVSTVRKKLKEYAEEGLIIAEKSGRTMHYSRAADVPLPPRDVLDFYTEVSPCGVIGSYLLDKCPDEETVPTDTSDKVNDSPGSNGTRPTVGAGSAYNETALTDTSDKVNDTPNANEARPEVGAGSAHNETALTDKSDRTNDSPGSNGTRPTVASGPARFAFKHHYITAVMDSEIICAFLEALSNEYAIYIKNENNAGAPYVYVPLKLMISAQNGRQYLMVYDMRQRRVKALRTDKVVSVEKAGRCEDMQKYRDIWENMKGHVWGISTEGFSPDRMEHLDMTVHYDNDEQHILRRLQREKRCGTVEVIDENTARFSADVYNVTELIPWVRTFICRITEIHISDEAIERRFLDDIQKMYRMYDEV